ncbi:hypothetical protein [Leptothrix ochracea]|uniref:hypothetical protein n=1 Tax=Leptothrix ochracea TaxID=735331 RepID=UPI0034E2E58C
MDDFAQWLACLLKQREDDVQRLLDDKVALYFLMTWTLFESKCFSGFMQASAINKFSERIVRNEKFDVAPLVPSARCFHERYQDSERLTHLLHDRARRPADLMQCLSTPFEELAPEKVVYFVVFVVFRYRNNMFHGNKRIQSWLRFSEQIALCTMAMQAFISHAEVMNPTVSWPVTE